jgi:phosphohistidine swiveling domain-containing protein
MGCIKNCRRIPGNVNADKVAASDDDLSGIPCSNGIAVGEVLVIDSPQNAVNVKDKILVSKMTDPGWVFMITLAKGIITEKGSLLSHTAIISRELNVPSIVGVKNITNILKTGDIIRMNGSTGKIELVRGKNG